MVEAAEYLGLEISDNEEYKNFLQEQLQIIYQLNKEAKEKYGYMFNTEFVPAENLGVKNSKWDRKDGYQVHRDCYNSYFYRVEDEDLSFYEKLKLHGQEVIRYLDGGSALHLNLEEYLSEEQYLKLLDIAAREGCNYFCTNVKVTVCNDCNFINKRTLLSCTQCHSPNVDHATRVIGYLKKVTSFGEGRRLEHGRRFYHI
jgi:ribonucleoside-triphosphate reductase